MSLESQEVISAEIQVHHKDGEGETQPRFVGPETIETKIFGRLTAWQNWIFIRPNASGPDGALRRFGTGRKGDYDLRRV